MPLLQGPDRPCNGVCDAQVWFARQYKAYQPNTLLLDNALATMGAGRVAEAILSNTLGEDLASAYSTKSKGPLAVPAETRIASQISGPMSVPSVKKGLRSRQCLLTSVQGGFLCVQTTSG